MTRDTKHEDPLAGFDSPRAPSDLAARTLAAANRALQSPGPVAIWDRVWSSVPLRVAWGVTTFALLLAHLGLSVTPSELPRTAISSAPTPRDSTELGELLRLPSVDISPRAAALCLGSSSKPKNRDRPARAGSTNQGKVS